MGTLFGYYRSSAAYRVRIALALKGIPTDHVAINLAPGKSEQHSDDYLAVNPQGRVPFWRDETVGLSQSIAILEYLEETHPNPALLPANSMDRAFVRQLVNIIACDIHPLNNLSVLGYLKGTFEVDEETVQAWYSHWIITGFAAFEALLSERKAAGPFCFGDTPTFADICLVPQVYNARRFGVPLRAFPLITKIDRHCQSLNAFKCASPEQQTDAV